MDLVFWDYTFVQLNLTVYYWCITSFIYGLTSIANQNIDDSTKDQTVACKAATIAILTNSGARP